MSGVRSRVASRGAASAFGHAARGWAKKACASSLLAGSIVLALPQAASAATATSTFNVNMSVTAGCLVLSAGSMSFPSTGVITAANTASSTISIQCTSGTAYTIALDGGVNGGTTTTRVMKSGSNALNYTLWRDSAYTQNWGNSTDTQSGTGNGAAQNYTVYGRVPVQTTPPPGSYSDTITVTVNY